MVLSTQEWPQTAQMVGQWPNGWPNPLFSFSALAPYVRAGHCARYLLEGKMCQPKSLMNFGKALLLDIVKIGIFYMIRAISLEMKMIWWNNKQFNK